MVLGRTGVAREVGRTGPRLPRRARCQLKDGGLTVLLRPWFLSTHPRHRRRTLVDQISTSLLGLRGPRASFPGEEQPRRDSTGPSRSGTAPRALHPGTEHPRTRTAFGVCGRRGRWAATRPVEGEGLQPPTQVQGRDSNHPRRCRRGTPTTHAGPGERLQPPTRGGTSRQAGEG